MSDQESGENRKSAAKKCQQCQTNDAKYRCPGCMARTCSVDCAKEHKFETGCSGQRDRTKFVKRADYDANTLFSDYGFLQELSRDHDTLTRIVNEQGVLTANKGKRRPNNAPNRPGGSVLTTAQKNVIARARANRNVNLRYLGPGIKRHAQNRTLWSNTHSRMVWTLEISVPELEGVPSKWVETGFHDVCHLGDLWERLLQLGSGDSRNPTDNTDSAIAGAAPPPRKRPKKEFVRITLPSDDGSGYTFKSGISHQTLDAIKGKFAGTAVSELTWLVKAQDMPANKPTFYRIDPRQPLHTQL
ncbi:Box C/D snoRNA accumulation, partial [Linderina macrospora]